MMKLVGKQAESWKLPIPPEARDYRRLRLDRREARIEIIREAINFAALAVRNNSSAEDETERKLAEIILSAYRILDPRRRRNLIERVQLVVSTELDSEAADLPVPPLALQVGDPQHPKRDLVEATPIAPGHSPLTVTMGDEKSFNVLAVQDVMAIIWKHEKSAKAKRLRAAAATFSTIVVLGAALLLSWISFH